MLPRLTAQQEAEARAAALAPIPRKRTAAEAEELAQKQEAARARFREYLLLIRSNVQQEFALLYTGEKDNRTNRVKRAMTILDSLELHPVKVVFKVGRQQRVWFVYCNPWIEVGPEAAAQRIKEAQQQQRNMLLFGFDRIGNSAEWYSSAQLLQFDWIAEVGIDYWLLQQQAQPIDTAAAREYVTAGRTAQRSSSSAAAREYVTAGRAAALTVIAPQRPAAARTAALTAQRRKQEAAAASAAYRRRIELQKRSAAAQEAQRQQEAEDWLKQQRSTRRKRKRTAAAQRRWKENHAR